MYVCVCMYVCMCVYVCMYVYIYLCMYGRILIVWEGILTLKVHGKVGILTSVLILNRIYKMERQQICQTCEMSEIFAASILL